MNELFTTIGDILLTTSPVNATTITLPVIFEFFAVAAAGVAGALVGCDRKLDLIGVTVLALVTGLGGGLLRDMILPTSHIYMLDNPKVVVVCSLIAVIVFYLRRVVDSLMTPINIADIVSVGLFTFVGAEKTVLLGYSPVISIMMGVITAVGGGMLRDICIGEVPNIFKAGNLYASAAIAGGTVYVGLSEAHVIKFAAACCCVVVTVSVRYLSLKYNLQTSGPRDMSRHVIGPIKHILRYPDGSLSTQQPSVSTSDAWPTNRPQVIVIEDVSVEEGENLEKQGEYQPIPHSGQLADKKIKANSATIQSEELVISDEVLIAQAEAEVDLDITKPHPEYIPSPTEQVETEIDLDITKPNPPRTPSSAN